jgi:hypothetical protein
MRKDKRSESGGTGRMDYYDGKEIFRNLSSSTLYSPFVGWESALSLSLELK